MDILNYVFNFIAKEILGVPAYLVGLMTLIGLIASRKKLGEIIGGALKATLGFIILGIGAGAVIGALNPLGTLITGATGATGVVPTNEAITAIVASTSGYAANIAYAMFFGVVLALVLARVTNLRYVFLTGHHMLFMATVLVVVMLAGAQADALWAVIVGAVGLATMMVIMPAFTHPWMKKVTGGEKVGMGHFGSLGYISAGFTGQVTARYLGKGRSTEELNIPESLRFLRDPMIGTAVAMIIIYLLLAIAFALRVGVDAAVTATSAGTGGWGRYLMAMFNQALIFGGGVAVILLGVRTILGEIVPAFAGIAERVIPGAVPALDCPVAFPYAPNAVIVGFLFSVVGGLAGLVVLVFIGKPLLALAIVIPGMIPHFFTGGTAGVFGNATGGTKGAMAGGFINGLLITILAAFLLGVMGGLGALAGTTFGDTDFQWFGIVVGNIAGFMEGIVAAIAVIVVCAVLIGIAMWWQARFVDKGWVPGGSSEAK